MNFFCLLRNTLFWTKNKNSCKLQLFYSIYVLVINHWVVFCPSPASTSRPSSRASSRSSRPPSIAGSDVSETSEPDVFTTMKTETRTVGGRPTTTVTYQTHQTQLRTLTVPPSATARTTTPTKIPRTSAPRKPKIPKWDSNAAMLCVWCSRVCVVYKTLSTIVMSRSSCASYLSWKDGLSNNSSLPVVTNGCQLYFCAKWKELFLTALPHCWNCNVTMALNKFFAF